MITPTLFILLEKVYGHERTIRILSLYDLKGV